MTGNDDEECVVSASFGPFMIDAKLSDSLERENAKKEIIKNQRLIDRIINFKESYSKSKLDEANYIRIRIDMAREDGYSYELTLYEKLVFLEEDIIKNRTKAKLFFEKFIDFQDLLISKNEDFFSRFNLEKEKSTGKYIVFGLIEYIQLAYPEVYSLIPKDILYIKNSLTGLDTICSVLEEEKIRIKLEIEKEKECLAHKESGKKGGNKNSHLKKQLDDYIMKLAISCVQEMKKKPSIRGLAKKISEPVMRYAKRINYNNLGTTSGRSKDPDTIIKTISNRLSSNKEELFSKFDSVAK